MPNTPLTSRGGSTSVVLQQIKPFPVNILWAQRTFQCQEQRHHPGGQAGQFPGHQVNNAHRPDLDLHSPHHGHRHSVRLFQRH